MEKGLLAPRTPFTTPLKVQYTSKTFLLFFFSLTSKSFLTSCDNNGTNILVSFKVIKGILQL